MSFIPAIHSAAGLLAATSTKPQTNSASLLIPILLIGAAFYFLAIRPRNQRVRQQQSMQQQAQVGDRIVTTAGLIGRIRGFVGDRIQLEIADGVIIEIVRQAVGRTLPDELDDEDVLIPPPPGAEEDEDESDDEDAHEEDDHDEADDHDEGEHIDDLPAYADEAEDDDSADDETHDGGDAEEEASDDAATRPRSRWRRSAR
ncbi:MAG TPA: preprotein translocase subunit YajC [Acidimicrobiales bacterium]|nr:preprotein translocase subunit YajC [Acidimicrobiales bacterium]